MLILRIGNRGRWVPDRVAGDAEHAEAAAQDLARKPDEPGLSVFRAEEKEQRQLAVRFAVTLRDAKPRPLDYIVFPAELAEGLGLTVAHVPQEGIDPFLGERHYEILGLTPELERRLAAAILASEEHKVERVGKGEIPPLASEICRRDPALWSFLGDGWPEKLAPLMDTPTPE